MLEESEEIACKLFTLEDFNEGIASTSWSVEELQGCCEIFFKFRIQIFRFFVSLIW